MTTVPKTDFKKVYGEFYSATTTPTLVEVPGLSFLAVDGTGDPNGPGYREALEALYGVSYAVRFALKRAGTVEYPVMPSQALWWGPEEHDHDITRLERSDWHWTVMIMQPPQVTPELVGEGIAATRRKRPSEALERLRVWDFAEGTAAQILHIGPYAEERPTIERLLAYVEGRGYQVSGRHHEIYLSHPHRTAPEKLKTIIRYPVVERSSPYVAPRSTTTPTTG